MLQVDLQYFLIIYWIDGGQINEFEINNQTMLELFRAIDSNQMGAFYKFKEVDGVEHRINKYKIRHIELIPQ